MSSNLPSRAELIDDPADIKMEIVTVEAMTNTMIFRIRKEDHTVGELLRSTIAKDPNVIFVGYKQPHPLEYFIEITVRTSEGSTPKMVFESALNNVLIDLNSLQSQILVEEERSRERGTGLGRP